MLTELRLPGLTIGREARQGIIHHLVLLDENVHDDCYFELFPFKPRLFQVKSKRPIQCAGGESPRQNTVPVESKKGKVKRDRSMSLDVSVHTDTCSEKRTEEEAYIVSIGKYVNT